ncbi:MAG TPA: helix-turn-helix transcriptional regulator [Terriglobales bacterium]|nr:helix-turn-helix transcriptional regulator [Terriglobales bacterium]
MRRKQNGKLAALRTSRKLSLRDISKKTGISLTRLWNIEQGNHVPKVDAAIKLARFHNTTVERLFA